MERLTEKHYSGNGYYLKCSSDCPNDGFCDDCEKLFKAIDRLGEYEDKAGQKPKTNADRIRAMTDEELAKECVRQFPMYLWPNGVRTIYFGMENHKKDNAIKAWMQWLQQPAKGE